MIAATRTHAHEADIDADEGGQTVADSANHGAIGNSVEPFRARCAGPRRLLAARAGAGIGSLFRVGTCGGVDRPHLRDDLLDLAGGHHPFVRSEIAPALVRDRLFEICHDLGAVRIGGQRLAGARQVVAEQLVAAVVELIRVAIQVDADDFLHGFTQAA